jgi:hypothetical protein
LELLRFFPRYLATLQFPPIMGTNWGTIMGTMANDLQKKPPSRTTRAALVLRAARSRPL